MEKYFLGILIFLVLISSGNAQNAAGPGKDSISTHKYHLQPTQDGGYIWVGETPVADKNQDLMLIRTNSVGDEVWQKTVGGTSADGGYFIQPLSDNGYIVTGYTTSFGSGGLDIWLLRINSLGDTLWTRTMGDSMDNWGIAVQQTADQGYVVLGFTQLPDQESCCLWLLRTNEKGETLWTRTFDKEEEDVAYALKETPKGGIYLASYNRSIAADGYNIRILLLNSSGDLVQEASFAEATIEDGKLYSQIFEADVN
jgi:hypothetical protein